MSVLKNWRMECGESDSLVDLLKRIPAFQSQHLKRLHILEEPYPQVKLAFKWVPTRNLACSHPFKRTWYYQKLASPQAISYSFVS